jgi:Fe-S-cluster-containing dehydrogenase component
MKKQYGVVVDLDRCVGCFACEVACKAENNLALGETWIRVYTLGPEKLDGRQRAEYLPIMLDGCTLCRHRIMQGLEPFCVQSCPVKALAFGIEKVILEKLASGKRFQLTKLIEINDQLEEEKY